MRIERNSTKGYAISQLDGLFAGSIQILGRGLLYAGNWAVSHSAIATPHFLRPQNFQAVVDLLDALDLADRFLGHLLLKVRLDGALQHHATALGFKPQRATIDVGAGLDGLIDARSESGFEGWHGNTN